MYTDSRYIRCIWAIATAFALCEPARGASEDHSHVHELGSVHFPVSCTAEAQKSFVRGMALLHSFWYDEAERAFSEATRSDPECAMGYWGIAMSFYHPIWAPPTEADLNRGTSALAKARSARTKTRRERDYIAALEAFYRDSDKLPHRTRALAWRNAMQQLSQRYPKDREAAIFFALALIATAPALDKTYASEKQAARILNRILREQPRHPGVAHYIIHSYDSPQLATLALPAALSYARIAPGAPHALHMPSHIFTRLGMWQDSISSNLASAAAAKKHVAKTLAGATSQDELHAMDYLVYAYLQSAQDGAAKRIVDQTAAVSKLDQEVFQAAYALAAIPARYALERKRWSAAAALQLRPAGFPWARFRYAEAITCFARALGSARSSDPSAARVEVEKLAAIQKVLAHGKESYDWATQVEVQRQAGLAWIAHAEGDDAAALRWMRSAADLEDKTAKHPVTPGPVLPARELLGELLMELDQPALALPEFESVLRTSPGRFNATYGVARSAELSGNRKRAREAYSKLLQLGAHSDTARLETQNARAFLQSR